MVVCEDVFTLSVGCIVWSSNGNVSGRGYCKVQHIIFGKRIFVALWKLQIEEKKTLKLLLALAFEVHIAIRQ